MSVRRLYHDQPSEFAFTPENRAWAEGQIAKYPPGRQASAVIPLLWRAQRQHGGWLPEPAIRHVAEILGMARMRVLEVATFYTMFNLEPVGKSFVQVCGNISCRLRGAEELMKTCENEIGPRDTVNEDSDMSWTEVECAGACVNGPTVQIGNDYFEDLDPDTLTELLRQVKAGETPAPGPRNGRKASEPLGGATTLLDETVIFEGWKSFSPQAGAAAGPEKGEAEENTGKARGRPAMKTPATGAGGAVDAAEEASTADHGAAATDIAESEPLLLSGAREGGADDLKRIKGVGPKLEGILNDMGFYHFDQIAEWGAEQIAWVDARLQFKGRIERDNWVDQAKRLAAGGETEFSRRVDKGEVPSSKKGG